MKQDKKEKIVKILADGTVAKVGMLVTSSFSHNTLKITAVKGSNAVEEWIAVKAVGISYGHDGNGFSLKPIKQKSEWQRLIWLYKANSVERKMYYDNLK